MHTEFTEFSTNAQFLISDHTVLAAHTQPKQMGYFSFVWATKSETKLIVDSRPVTIKANQILALTPIQYVEFLTGDDLIVYRFNRDFYCIKDHDQSVGCAGLLFFGNDNLPVIELDTQAQHQFDLLHQVFLEELNQKDTIQAEMLRALMARFIIKSTRLLKNNEAHSAVPKSKTELVRAYNVLVETHFKDQHSVGFYADMLHKSPKTLSNSFSKFGRSPLQIIHDRIVLETKRLLHYSDKSAKEIAYEIGFEDASHLSKLFKKNTGYSPIEFRQQQKIA
ncbi:MAG: helix-turn-helix domain-containing protein [Gilvibacter sp.]